MSEFITKIVTPINSPVKKKETTIVTPINSPVKKKRQQLLTLNLQEKLI